jgi:hypothetical protein
MPLSTFSGTATNVTLGSQMGYVPTAQYGPMAVQQHLVNFRINNRPVRFKIADSASISEGDQVIVAGNEKQGTLEGLALRNATTGAIHHNPYQMPLILGIVAGVISLPLCLLLIGIPLLAISGWVVWKAKQVQTAVRMVSTSPMMQSAIA